MLLVRVLRVGVDPEGACAQVLAERRPAVLARRAQRSWSHSCSPRYCGAVARELRKFLIKQRRRALASCSSSARNVGDSSRLRRTPSASSSSAKIARASGVHAASPACHCPASHVAQLLEPVDGVEDAAHDELRRDDAVPAVLLEPERDVVALLAPEAVELRADAERDRRAGVAAALAHAEAQVLAVADRRRRRRPRSRRRAASPPGCRARTARAGRAPRRGRASSFAPGDDRVDVRDRAQVVVRRAPRRRARRTPPRTTSICSARIVRPAAARWPPKRSRCAAHAARPAVQVERRDRAARALPLAVGAGDQHDRPVVALDEPRGDDADHALVPALARDDVAAAAAARLGPRLDLGRSPRARMRSSTDLALAVQRLELLGELLRLALVLGQEQRERGLRAGRAGPTR